MTIYTIGFTKRSAESFFTALKENDVELLADVRLNTASQLAGFAKGGDLPFFLRELCGAAYVACPELAPSKELLSGYRKGEIPWERYEDIYRELLEERDGIRTFLERVQEYGKICLLCSEATPEHCHRRLAAEQTAALNGAEVVHL